MRDVLIIAHFTQVPGEHANGRFDYIADMMASDGNQVEIITTKFSHRDKSQRKVSQEQLDQLNYNLTMLKERGYKKNVSLMRFYSHQTFSKSLSRYLKTRKKPDVIYCAIPSLDAAYVAAKYARKNKVRFIIDVQDLWPEAFKMVFDIPKISNLTFKPMNNKADYIYNAADDIVAVSDTYLKRALSANEKLEKGLSVYLGTDLSYFDECARKNPIEKPEDEIWLAYIGTLGHSYDLSYVIDALAILNEERFHNIKFIVMGDGPKQSDFEKYAAQKNVHVQFTGRLSYESMVGVLNCCDIAINPIKSKSAGSIINKVGDYAAAGLPTINTQESPEYRALLTTYNAGVNCGNKSPHDLAHAIKGLCENKDLREQLGKNNRKLAVEKFDRKSTYPQIISKLIVN
ncbi:glycosyltransferase family 4 protein [Halobacillus faecis]